jgi:hypothetical protein
MTPRRQAASSASSHAVSVGGNSAESMLLLFHPPSASASVCCSHQLKIATREHRDTMPAQLETLSPGFLISIGPFRFSKNPHANQRETIWSSRPVLVFDHAERQPWLPRQKPPSVLDLHRRLYQTKEAVLSEPSNDLAGSDQVQVSYNNGWTSTISPHC